MQNLSEEIVRSQKFLDLKALLHVSRFDVLSSALCGMGIGFPAWSAFMRFCCLYTASTSLHMEPDLDDNLCDKHVTKVANWNSGVIQDVLLFDFDVVLGKASTMLPFFDNISDATTDAAILLFWADLQSHDISPT